jgi:type IV fimbrial biogenesis protein FimT
MRMKKRHSGFTTIELMTTVLIAGIVVGLAVPSYSRFVASARVTEQTNDLVGAMQLARSEAIKRNRQMFLCRTSNLTQTNCENGDASWINWMIVANASDGTGEVLRRGSLSNYAGTQHVSSDLPEERIRYLPDGLAYVSTGALVNNQEIRVCSTRYSNENIRDLALGASSRVTINRESGPCS